MFIKYFKAVGFKRTALFGTRDIEINFDSPTQIILGTNGSGKSELLKQLTPLPPENEEYFENATKIIEIEDNGVNYRLVSTKKNSFKHEFWRDGLNLNIGGTVTVQRELVKRYFNLTDELMRTLLGRNLFTFQHLSPRKRGELFTQLCPVDLSYAMSVFQKVKTGALDAGRVRKHLEGRISQETERLLDEKEQRALSDSCDQLRQEINELLSHRDLAVVNDRTDYKAQLISLDATIQQSAKTILNTNIESLGEWSFKSRGEFEAALSLQQSELIRLQSNQTSAITEFNELEGVINSMRETSGINRASVEQRLAELKHLQSQADTTKSRFELPTSLRQALEDTGDIRVPLLDAIRVVSRLHVTGRDFSPAAIAKLNEERDALYSERTRTITALERLGGRLEHIQHSPEADCPSCKNRFTLGVRKGEEETVKESIERGELKRKELDAAIKSADDGLQQVAEFEDQVSRVRSMARAYPLVRGLIDVFVEEGFPLSVSHEHISIFEQWERDLKTAIELKQVEIEIEKHQEVIVRLDQLEAAGGGSVLSERAQRLEISIEKLTSQIQETRAKLASLQAFDKASKVVAELHESIETKLLPAREEALKKAVEKLRQEEISICLEAHQNQLGILSAKANAAEVARSILEDIKSQLEIVKRQEKGYKRLQDILDPADGLIAEQLTGFIVSFVGYMNELLEKIWNYPIRVLPCGMEKGELDYKFPLQIKGGEPAPDVSNGSLAQRDVVDFVFMLAVAKFSGKGGLPIYLDELGSHFDEAHRQKVMGFVRDYCEAGLTPQVFLISHYASNHAAFTHAATLVLDGENISLSGVVNQNVTLG